MRRNLTPASFLAKRREKFRGSLERATNGCGPLVHFSIGLTAIRALAEARPRAVSTVRVFIPGGTKGFATRSTAASTDGCTSPLLRKTQRPDRSIESASVASTSPVLSQFDVLARSSC